MGSQTSGRLGRSWTTGHDTPKGAADVDDEHDHPDLIHALEPGEQVRARAEAADAVLAVTERRVVVANPTRIALAVPIDGIRRVQFDIERARPATMVIVPEHPDHEAQVLTIPPQEYEAAAQAFVTVGLELAGLGRGQRSA
jgi:hypothetical protein